jgi:C-terminal processing protease CtpA/Prc
MGSRLRRFVAVTAVGLAVMAPALLGLSARIPSAQGLGVSDAYYIRAMLKNAYEAVKAHYYDPAFHGLDWDARYQEFDDKLKSAASVDAGQMVVAQFLDGLGDSHTFFEPSARSFQVDYGYIIGLIGDDAFVTHVRPGTDAASKVKAGDRVITLSGYDIDRAGFIKLQYILNTLAPRSSTTLTLRDGAGGERTVTIASTVHSKRIARLVTNGNELSDVLRQGEDATRFLQSRHQEHGDVMIWKMPAFMAGNSEIDGLFDVARKHAALILDLRGNAGGRVDTLARMLGDVFDHDVPIGSRHARGGARTLTASTRGRNVYPGKLIVLIDSASGSASELFARVIQLEHRGIVIGDRSAGAVMEALSYPFGLGNDNLLYYMVSVTDADLVMRDGQSLEHRGVMPDELVQPSAQDLAIDRDPVLAHAAQLAGLILDPIAAGKLFPFEWRPF